MWLLQSFPRCGYCLLAVRTWGFTGSKYAQLQSAFSMLVRAFHVRRENTAVSIYERGRTSP